jgi:hypothetical protein
VLVTREVELGVEVARSERRAAMTDEMTHSDPASDTASGVSEPASDIKPSADRTATRSASSVRWAAEERNDHLVGGHALGGS